MTLGGRKRQLSVLIDCMLSDAYPSEAMNLGQWLMELGHSIVLSEATSMPMPVIQQTDLSMIERDIPPENLN